jgi:hypothetical protein
MIQVITSNDMPKTVKEEVELLMKMMEAGINPDDIEEKDMRQVVLDTFINFIEQRDKRILTEAFREVMPTFQNFEDYRKLSGIEMSIGYSNSISFIKRNIKQKFNIDLEVL